MQVRLLLFMLVAAGAPMRADAQYLTTVARSDSSQYETPTLSPDARWLVTVRRVSNQESQLVIRRLGDGADRVLPVEKGNHDAPVFAPRGDRLYFVSTIPRRTPTDTRRYVVSVPFDASQGILVGPVRQVTLDGVRTNFRIVPRVSPDGKWLAYVECCETNALRVIPTSGGNARSLANGTPGNQQLPGFLSWAPDSRSVLYHVRQNDSSYIRRANVADGKTTVVSRFSGPGGLLSPDQKHLVVVDGTARRYTLRVRTIDGRELASMPTPFLQGMSFDKDGASIVASVSNATAITKLVPADGGEIRTIGRRDTYEWPVGWDDAYSVQIEASTSERRQVRVTGLDGVISRTVPFPGARFGSTLRGNEVFYKELMPGTSDRWRFVARDVATGAKRELARDILVGCCDPSAPTGFYYGFVGDETYLRREVGNKRQYFAQKLSGPMRLIAEVPRADTDIRVSAVHGSSMAYWKAAGDSVRLYVSRGPGQTPRMLATVAGRGANLGEIAFSADGRKLATYLDGIENTQRLLVFEFGANGEPIGRPISAQLPFEYFYEMFWRPDGTGLTVIAQPKGARVTEIALIRLSDPYNPVLLTKADVANKWGHAPSPDGKWIAYPSEWGSGSSVVRVDLKSLLKSSGTDLR